MSKKYQTLFVLLTTTFLFTGCIIQEDRYDTQPQEPVVGYQAIFNEDFSNDTRGWAFDDPQDSAYAFVRDGAYKFVDYSYTGGYHTAVVPTGAPAGRNFLVQSRLTSNYAMALIFGASNSDYGYSFFIDETGYFAVYEEGYPAQTIIDWQYSADIQSGWNDVEVEQVDGYWYGYINGAKVFQTPARGLTGTQCGFMVLANTTGFADYLTVKW
jgi:hypothetical protein